MQSLKEIGASNKDVSAALDRVMAAFETVATAESTTRYDIAGSDCWDLRITLQLGPREAITIRNLQAGDVPLLREFGRSLSRESKKQFCPYPWASETELNRALMSAIGKSLEGIDVGFLMLHEGRPMGHFFLWKAGGNAHSKAYGVQVPELGVAIADSHQRQGLGGLAVRILQVVGQSLNADAIELTTALSNRAGWRTYLSAGFEYVGIIRNPLEVDATEAIAGLAPTDKYRRERQMVYCINDSKRDLVMQYLEIKRLDSA